VTFVRVRAPASTANLGAGFDCAAVALDVWNELEVAKGGEADENHLGVRAFSLLASPKGFSFRFSDRIPRERGLGSSAAAVALGLVAACAVAGREPEPEALLALGTELEGHADNLAAALTGGVCLTWDGRIERIADDVPATPIVLLPEEGMRTAEARALLPETVPHADAVFNVARATLLGAALAQGDSELFATALADRLHEPYRSPFLKEVRLSLPEDAVGATLSGAGPSVVVWARKERAATCEEDLRQRHPNHQVLRLDVSREGASAQLSQRAS
jgi:homoserine kinase